MCELPPRRAREAFPPTRIALAVTAVAIVVVGLRIEDYSGVLVVGLGLAVLATAVLFPVVKQVECGFPAGVKITAGVRDRQEELRRAFEQQKGELQLCTQLLCNDPGVAARLLETAWARVAAKWRGPVTTALRLYLLCVVIELLDSDRQWFARPGPEGSATPLEALSPRQRTAVVLREFLDLSPAEIAGIMDRSEADVTADLRSARTVLDLHGGTP
jgi:DNA-binding CsgD family transcriptional regulator